MQRISLLLVAGAMILALVAGVAIARTFQCNDNTCTGTDDRDKIKEQEGSNNDNIEALAGPDRVRANVRGNDTDNVAGNENGDRLLTNDGDERDSIDCGSGNDTANVDPGDSVNVNCETIRGGMTPSPPPLVVDNPDAEGFGTAVAP